MEEGSSNPRTPLGRQEGDDAKSPAVEGDGVEHTEHEEQENADVRENAESRAEGEDYGGEDGDQEMDDEPGEEVGAVGQAHHLHAFAALALLLARDLRGDVVEGDEVNYHEEEWEELDELLKRNRRDVDKLLGSHWSVAHHLAVDRNRAREIRVRQLAPGDELGELGV